MCLGRIPKIKPKSSGQIKRDYKRRISQRDDYKFLFQKIAVYLYKTWLSTKLISMAGDKRLNSSLL